MISAHHAVVGPSWVCNARPKSFSENTAISNANAALAINIKLGVLYLLAQHQVFSVMVFYFDFIRLVATRPNNQVSLLKILNLVFCRGSFYALHSFLGALCYFVVEHLGVASQACVRVNEAIGVAEYLLAKLRVPISLCDFDSAVKNSDFVSIKDFNASHWVIFRHQRIVIEIPFIVLEMTVTDTNTPTFVIRLFLFLFRAMAAI